ncbi:Uncharacterised protein [Mycobacteroides abscessus subsp. abscessus]|nr:Uncharacterised protein [Mycobacteroides abscessus subsp. abscessus]
MIGHPQPDYGIASLRTECRALLLGEITVIVVIAQFGIAPRSKMAGLNFLRRGECLIGLPCLQQLAHHLPMQLLTL